MERIVDQLDAQMLTGVVRRALGSENGVIETWQINPIAYANVDPGSRGLWRVQGTADGAGSLHP